MAFGGSLYGSFTTNCLDDIPFKLGPKFKPPTKYTFEVEEAVLKWSAEREKQSAEQRRLEQEIAESVRQAVSKEDVDQQDTAPSESLYANAQTGPEPLYENPGILLPQPAPRPKVRPKPKDEYVNVLVPNPLIANISNDILKPMPSSSPSENGVTEDSDSKTASKSNDLDLTWFEKEDNPFDNLELQTINDMEELASVLEETKKISPEPNVVQSENTVGIEANGEQIDNSAVEHDGDEDVPNYENVELKLVDLKRGSKEIIYDNNKTDGLSLTNLPPVPPRRDLVGRSPPLPPIGQSYSDPTFSQTINQSSEQKNGQSENIEKSDSIDASFQREESATKVISKRRVALPKPPRTFTYSRHDLDNSDTTDTNDSNYENTQPKVSIDSVGTNINVQFTNSHQTQNLQSNTNSSDGLNFINHHFGEEEASSANGPARPQPAPRKPVPPPRPTQPWNRYSPLPPTPRSASEQPSTVSLPARTSPDLYRELSTEAQGCVDKLAMMGFQKDRLARAVEKIGHDEKEVVEYLCLVDQLIEKGYNTHLAENALLMFQNSMKQASDYLELYTQMQELGFNGDKIKEALVNTNNDREKALDILTASS
ncbi:ubiquitin-associated protein 1-like [Mercenaria mercenaria]|uniref:ubiquitin-associated protein 1-like n=1 Tax=Mercenaria mercenaria TaxID=6596 RepID=UPI00234E42BE|nr:ubiquitin-associated protein 1-like [Mercenaria mercenaria]